MGHLASGYPFAPPSGGGLTSPVAIADGGTGQATAAAAATALGLGTGDSPQFTAIELGHASNTSIARSGAGKVAVEGKAVPLMSGAFDLVLAGPTAARTWTGQDADATFVFQGDALPVPNASKSTAYTTVLADANKSILHPTTDNNARTFTIDSNANVAYPVGTMITFVNMKNTVTIAITTDTMYLAGTGLGTTGSRTLAAGGIATAIKTAATEWLISGSGLT